jgi:uncharacterized membrane protein HdeD (DUF308 family)
MSTQPDLERFRSRVGQVIRDHWVLYMVEGVVLVILGLLAIVLPPIATLAVTLVLGWLFLLSGLVGLFTTFWLRHAPGFWWSLLSALLAIGTGIVLLVWPVSGALSLTLLLVAFFIVEGIASIMFALEHKRELTGRWGWMLASGIVDLILVAIILSGFPETGAWAIGLLVGINMVMGGTSLIAMALYARSNAPTVTTSGATSSV